MHATHDHAVVSQLTLEAGQSKKLDLGHYETGMPQPDFCIKCSDEACDHIEVTLTRQEGFGEYALIYLLENSNQQAAKITVLSCEGA